MKGSGGFVARNQPSLADFQHRGAPNAKGAGARAFLEESGYVGLDHCVSDLLAGLDSQLDGVTGTIPSG